MSIPLFILYGSATGNSQKIAQDLAATYENTLPPPFTEIICCQGNDFKRKCSPIWETEPSSGKYGLVLITATSGNGDPPENISRFQRYLKRKTTPDTKPFRHVSFGVLGLGDTNYDKFCETAKVADKCLQKCGGTRSKPLGCADEGTGLEDVVESWVVDVVPILSKACSGNIDQDDGKREDTTKSEEKKDDDALGMRPGFYGLRPDITNTTMLSRGSIPNVSAIRSRVANQQQSSSVSHSKSSAPVESIPTVPEKLNSSSIVPTVKSVDIAAGPISSPTPLCILYGSATGNGEHIAKDLATKYEKMISESSSCYFPKVICCELDKYKKNCMSYWEDDSSLNNDLGQKHGILIVSSTTGNGEAPENASRFVRYIKRKTTAPTMPFRHVAYAVLGLGDTNYDQFCNTAKIIDKKINELGGVRVKTIACADEGTGLEETVDPWVDTIFDILIKRCRGNANTLSKDSMEVETEKTVIVDDKPDISPGTAISGKINVPLAQAPKDSVVHEDFCAGISMLRKLLATQSPKSSAQIPIVNDNSIPVVSSALSSYQVLDETKKTEQLPSCEIPLADMETMTVSSASSSGINYTIACPFDSQIVGARYLTNTEVKCAKAVSDTYNSRQLDSNIDIDDILITAAKDIQLAFPLDIEEGKVDDDELYSRNGKRVIAMTLSLPEDSSLEYSPGDSIGLVASNTPEATKCVLNMLNMNHGIMPTMQISVDLGEAMSVEQVIRHRLDLCSPIKNKRILAQLSHFATNKHEETALRFLSSKEPLAEEIFHKYIEGQCRSVIDILQEFPSCQCVTLNGLLAVIPSITPRYYSICSSPLEISDDRKPTLNVVFSVVDYIIPEILPHMKKRRIGGLVTSHLERICAPLLCKTSSEDNGISLFIPRVRIFPKPSSDFHLPAQLTRPLILIGPGTGIAPFMGFLAHRKAEISALDATQAAKVASEGTWRGNYTIDKNDLSVTTGDASGLSVGNDFRSSQKVGEVDVYFGCRHSDHDWLFKNEMETFEKEGIITNLNVSFSREGGSAKKAYVQDKMKSNADRVARMIIDDNAIIFICGDGNKMAKDVQQTLIEIIEEYKTKTSSDDSATIHLKAKQYFERMKVEERLVLDIWS